MIHGSWLMGDGSIPWGYEFSFPQLFQDEEGNIIKTAKTQNGEAFKKLGRWLRNESHPMQFEFDGKTIKTFIKKLNKNKIFNLLK